MYIFLLFRLDDVYNSNVYSMWQTMPPVFIKLVGRVVPAKIHLKDLSLYVYTYSENENEMATTLGALQLNSKYI